MPTQERKPEFNKDEIIAEAESILLLAKRRLIKQDSMAKDPIRTNDLNIIKDSAREIGRIIANRSNPKHLPSRIINTSSDLTKGFGGCIIPAQSYDTSNFLGDNDRIVILQHGPLKHDDQHNNKFNIDANLIINSTGRVFLKVDSERFPEALDFEKPEGHEDSEDTFVVNNGSVSIGCNFYQLGNNTIAFIQRMIGSALDEYRSLSAES